LIRVIHPSSPANHDIGARAPYRGGVKAQTLHREPPPPATVAHLRADDWRGAAVAAAAVAATAAGVWLSLAGPLVLWIPGQCVLAVSFVHWFVLLHECGHRTLFRTASWHETAGRIAGFMAIIPFRCWQRVHARHHRWTGWQDLDPTTEALTPRPRSRLHRAVVNVCWRLWIPVFSVVYRVSNYWNVARLATLFPSTADRRAMAVDAGVLLCAYAALVFLAGPWVLLRVVGAALVAALVLEDLLLLSQHTHVPQQVSGGETVRPFPALQQEVFTRSLRLPEWLSTVLLHFDAHELHHMYPNVPGYRLGAIAYAPANEVDWLQWIGAAKRLSGTRFLFSNRNDSGASV
jgi:acyl-lipid omega-6 desaturase (Delta-12 desaturase)